MIDIAEILDYWSFWSRPISDSVPRAIALPTRLYDQLALVIQGVRRCGKSTLLSQMINLYSLDTKKCFFINFEDARLINDLRPQLLDTMLQYARGLHGQDTPLYFFLDEIQHVQGWERWLNTQLERPAGNYFVITCSNASLLSGELASSMTGRYTALELYPFDFSEFKRACTSRT